MLKNWKQRYNINRDTTGSIVINICNSSSDKIDFDNLADWLNNVVIESESKTFLFKRWSYFEDVWPTVSPFALTLKHEYRFELW